MKQVVLQKPDGSRRYVMPGLPFQFEPGEKVVGQAEVDEEGYEFRIGDAVARLAKPIAAMLGKTNCASCEARRQVLNLWRKLGTKSVLELMAMSVSKPAEEVAAEMKRRLSGN